MTPASDAPPRLARAAQLGALGGLLTSAAYLAAQFVRARWFPRPCGGLPLQECTLLRQAARELAWLQGLAALALLLLAFGLARVGRAAPKR